MTASQTVTFSGCHNVAAAKTQSSGQDNGSPAAEERSSAIRIDRNASPYFRVITREKWLRLHDHARMDTQVGKYHPKYSALDPYVGCKVYA